VVRIIYTRILMPTLSTLPLTRRERIIPLARTAAADDELNPNSFMPRISTGSTCGRTFTALFCAILVSLTNVTPAAFSQQTEELTSVNDKSPRGALWRAAALPGWGQFYNGQYVKIPFVWAGIGGIAATAIIVNKEYLLYRHSYHFLSRRDNGEPVFPEYEADFLTLINKLGISRERAEASVAEFRQSRDKLRRNRDLLYIGIGLFYGLTILDAYVNAHLLQFDVGEDLTLAVQPTPAGISATVRLGR
jgi:hypothetical protein